MSDDILDRLKAACVGHPNSKIKWPHRLLHDAIQEIINLQIYRDNYIREILNSEREEIIERFQFEIDHYLYGQDTYLYDDGQKDGYRSAISIVKDRMNGLSSLHLSRQRIEEMDKALKSMKAALYKIGQSAHRINDFIADGSVRETSNPIIWLDSTQLEKIGDELLRIINTIKNDHPI